MINLEKNLSKIIKNLLQIILQTLEVHAIKPGRL